MDIGRSLKAIAFGVSTTGAALLGSHYLFEQADASTPNQQQQIAAINTCAADLQPGDASKVPASCEGFFFAYDSIETTRYSSREGTAKTTTQTTYHLPTGEAFVAEQTPLVPTDAEVARRTKRLYEVVGGFAMVLSTAAGYAFFRKPSEAIEGEDEYDDDDEAFEAGDEA
jgi:hypothetical protein